MESTNQIAGLTMCFCPGVMMVSIFIQSMFYITSESSAFTNIPYIPEIFSSWNLSL